MPAKTDASRGYPKSKGLQCFGAQGGQLSSLALAIQRNVSAYSFDSSSAVIIYV